MKMTIESTTKFVTLNGVPARLWEGTSESGTPVFVFVTRVGILGDHDATEFERELTVQRLPSAEGQAFPARLIL
jgi:hypothetical protein